MELGAPLLVALALSAAAQDLRVHLDNGRSLEASGAGEKEGRFVFRVCGGEIIFARARVRGLEPIETGLSAYLAKEDSFAGLSEAPPEDQIIVRGVLGRMAEEGSLPSCAARQARLLLDAAAGVDVTALGELHQGSAEWAHLTLGHGWCDGTLAVYNLCALNAWNEDLGAKDFIWAPRAGRFGWIHKSIFPHMMRHPQHYRLVKNMWAFPPDLRDKDPEFDKMLASSFYADPDDALPVNGAQALEELAKTAGEPPTDGTLEGQVMPEPKPKPAPVPTDKPTFPSGSDRPGVPAPAKPPRKP